MLDELLTEVDSEDRVIGPRARGEIHRLGLRHRSVHILVFNHCGELFLQQRAASKDINPGLWDTSAAGHVDHGESYDACARRELREELGIEAPDLPAPLFKLPASALTGWEFVEVYRLVHAGELRLNADEIAAGDWLSPAEVDRRNRSGTAGLTASFRLIWTRYREHFPA